MLRMLLPVVALLALVVILLAVRLLAGKERVALGRRHCSHQHPANKN